MVRRREAEHSGAMDNASPSTEQPTPGTPPPSGPRVTRDEMKDLGRLRRSVTDRHVAGVAGGIARHLDVDPIIVRVALVVATFFGGAGLLLYVAAWILVPEEGTDDEPLGLDRRSRTIALGGVGVLALIAALGDWAGAFWFPWPLAIVAALVVVLLSRRERSAPTSGYGYQQPPTGSDVTDSSAYASTPYDFSYAPSTTAHWDQYAAVPRQPRNPRKRGPILFWFTAALAALGIGVLGIADLAGAEVAVVDDEVADLTVRCFEVTVAPEEVLEICLTPEGVLARLAAGDDQLELVQLDDDVDDDDFEVPDGA